MDSNHKKVETAKRIFETAETFHLVKLDARRRQNEEILNLIEAGEHQGGRIYTVAPIATLGAFSLELYFKALATLDSGNTPRGHHLHALFTDLTLNTRRLIEKHFDLLPEDPGLVLLNQVGKGVADLEGLLRESSKAFSKFRYLFELDNSIESPAYTLGRVIVAVRNAIFERMPDWKGAVPNVFCTRGAIARARQSCGVIEVARIYELMSPGDSNSVVGEPQKRMPVTDEICEFVIDDESPFNTFHIIVSRSDSFCHQIQDWEQGYDKPVLAG